MIRFEKLLEVSEHEYDDDHESSSNSSYDAPAIDDPYYSHFYVTRSSVDRAVEGLNTCDSDDGCKTNGCNTNGCDTNECHNEYGNDGSNDCAIDSPMVVAKAYRLEGRNKYENNIMTADDRSYRGMVDAITDGAIDSSMEATNGSAVLGVNTCDSDDGCDSNGRDIVSGNDGAKCKQMK